MGSDQPNAILTFQDKDGHEWIGAAIVGPLTRIPMGNPAAQLVPPILTVDKMRDQGFVLARCVIVERD